MDDDELKSTLKKAGFSPYQADAYIALIGLGSASAAELAEESGVPGPRIYDVIRDLDAKDYVEMYDQGSLHARIHDPDAAARNLEDRAEEFSDASEEIQERWEHPEIDTHSVSIVRRFETVHKQAATEIGTADNQIQLSATLDQFDRLEPELRLAAENEVHVRVSLHPEDVTDDSTAGDIETSRFEDVCTEVRYRELPSPFMAIVDRNQVYFSPHKDSVDEYGVIVNDPTHAYVFNSYFLTTLWEPWPTAFTSQHDDLPRSYVDFHRCVYDLEPLLEDGATVHAQVTGTELATADSITVTGEITETRFDSGTKTEDRPPVTELDGVVSTTIETDDGTYTVGGWGAMIEDVEATRITITDVEYPD